MHSNTRIPRFHLRGQDGAYPEARLTQRAGNLYGTAYQGGSSNRGTVFKLARNGSGWTFSPLYNFTGRADGSAPIAAKHGSEPEPKQVKHGHKVIADSLAGCPTKLLISQPEAMLFRSSCSADSN